MKYLKFVGAVILVGFSLVGIWSISSKFAASSKSVSVHMPGPLPAGHIAPSEEFLADYANYKKLDKEVTALKADSGLIEKQRLLQGTIDALNSQIPAGYVWDEPSMSFKPRPLPPPVAPAPEKK